MTWTIRAVDDEQITLGSNDSGDIARVFRLLGYDLPIDPGTRLEYVFVTIYKTTLTEGASHARITSTGDDSSVTQDDLPF